MDIAQGSPANLKAACMDACRKRYDRNDQWVLKGFFEAAAGQQACLDAIESLPLERFKPLGYFLRGKTKNPDDKVVELVAWLVDFTPRPYNPAIDYSKISQPSRPIETPIEALSGNLGKIKNGPEPISPEPIKDIPQPTSPVVEKKKRKRRRIIIAITISVAFGMPAYMVWTRKPPRPAIDGQACMFWAGDHYQPIRCNEKVENVQVIALDTAILYHLRKITQADTITINSAGHVWYARYRGNYEFYTAPGYHPLEPSLRLRPASAGIIIHHTPEAP